ncbi:MAG TPA: sigma-54 dependent transcriptional regulator [Gemmatimonadaceae bacterium]|nr:sigma-54 dependent transcriptional regulator [Gemmatimonadaceae bacterium]
MRSLLLIEDELHLLHALSAAFERDGWSVLRAADGPTGVELYERHHPQVVVTDMHLPGWNGLQVLHVLRQRDPDAAVILLTGDGDIPTAVEAMHLGAENYLTKPIELDQLATAVARAHERARLRNRHRHFRERPAEAPGLGALGCSPQMRAVASQVRAIADGDAPALLLGESGSGKGWAAQMIHSLSPRSRAPFVEVNCASLTATFLESELFGHERGAFTDAKAAKRGLFEVAHGGTLFLDEIGELSLELQPKLLKVLESGRFRRLGGTHEITAHVRVIAATNLELERAVRAQRFRADLFYRLAVLPLTLPPLRERGRDEIADLAFSILTELRRRHGRGPTRIASAALAVILRHPWPGNIRQLRNVLERVVLLAGEAEELRPEHLPAELRGDIPAPALSDDGDLSLVAAERQHIARVLARCGGNRLQAARVLGITRSTLYKRLREYGLEQIGRAS